MRIQGRSRWSAGERAERVTKPGLFPVRAAQALSSFSGDAPPDRNAGRAGFDRQGQSNALIEDACREGALSEAGAPGDADRVGLENVAARLLDDIDDPADAPRPGHQEPRGAIA